MLRRSCCWCVMFRSRRVMAKNWILKYNIYIFLFKIYRWRILLFEGLVRPSVCRDKLKLLYPFDNRIIIAYFAKSHCCRFGKWKSPNIYEITPKDHSRLWKSGRGVKIISLNLTFEIFNSGVRLCLIFYILCPFRSYILVVFLPLGPYGVATGPLLCSNGGPVALP